MTNKIQWGWRVRSKPSKFAGDRPWHWQADEPTGITAENCEYVPVFVDDPETSAPEAPAEGAVEREAIAAIMQRNMIPDDDGGFSFHDLKAADQIMDYLRARSSAPEARS